MRGIYAIVDTDALAARGLDAVAFAEAVLDARPAAMQLRDKHGGSAATLAMLRDIAPIAARAGVPFFANDRPDLAVLANCDGVHLGQEDVPVAVAREVGIGAGRTDLRVGVSTHDEAQVVAALVDAPDYVAIGPVFTTGSKARPSPVLGLAELEALVSRARRARPDVPIVAIGGIGLETAPDVAALCDAVAVIAALMPGPDAREPLSAARDRARALVAALAHVALRPARPRGSIAPTPPSGMRGGDGASG